MRDAFIDHVHEAARENPKLMFLSADFGAKALDRFREELPASSSMPASPNRTWSIWGPGSPCPAGR